MKRILFTLVLLAVTVAAVGQKSRNNVPYRTAPTDKYAAERCVLDVYVPEKCNNPATLVWFHGGGLTGGEKFVPDVLKNQNIVVVAVNYRLSPKAPAPAYIDDAAAATAWAFEHVKEWGGSADRIYVSGHSAGGYLALMLALDKQYLGKYGVDADKVRKYIPVSGQTITHNAIREERGLNPNVPLVDGYAPLNCVRKSSVPMIIITAQRDREFISRYEENAYLYSTLKALGNPVTIYEMEGFDHGSVVDPACYVIIQELK